MTIAEHGGKISGITEAVRADVPGIEITCPYAVSIALPVVTVFRRASTGKA